MENRAHALAAGLFAVLLGAALVIAVWWFSGVSEPTREYVLVSTGSVSGLNPQATVRYRGIPAGRVTSIRLDPDDPRKILVRVEIRADLPITKGTRAHIAQQGVTGIGYIQLTDSGKNMEPLTNEGEGVPRLPLEPGLMDQLTDTALDAAQRFRQLMDRVMPLFDDENLRRVVATLERLESAAVGIDRTFAEAPETLAAIREVVSPANRRRLAEALENLERASGEAGPALAEMHELMRSLQGTAKRIDEATAAAGEGLIDTTLPQLNALLKELTETSRRMGRVIAEVEAAPQILIRGRSQAAPGPGEPGFEAGRP